MHIHNTINLNNYLINRYIYIFIHLFNEYALNKSDGN